MSSPTASEIARWIAAEHAARHAFVAAPGLAARGLDFAYDVQDALVASRSSASGAKRAGYKIGLTTPRMQHMCGLDHPIAGVILSDGVHHAPVTLNAASFVRLGLECELAARLGEPLDGRSGALSIERVARAVDGIAAAFEIIEDRSADYARLDMRTLIADDSWNAGVVLGPVHPVIDIANLRGRLRINGVATDAGATADVLGHPLNAVAWLCEHLVARGGRLEAGDWVMTGSIVPTRFPRPGDVYSFSIDGLSGVEVRVS